MAADPNPSVPAETDDFDSLLSRHSARVYGFVHRLVGADEAEDACQDVWLAIYRSLPRFRGEAAITTWMFAIAARVCQRRRQLQRSRPPMVEESAAAELADGRPGPEQSALGGELQTLVREAIDRLPAGQREAVHLRQLEDCSYAEIAGILGIPVGTVRSRLHHGMARLAELLAPYLEIPHEAR